MLGFIKTALKDYTNIAAIFPSSPFASRSVAKRLPEKRDVIVEYGPGDGSISKEILKRMPTWGKLIAVEINEDFAEQLRTAVPDPRLTVVHGDIREISSRLKDWAPEGVDAVVSGIPFSFLTKEMRQQVVGNTYDGLRKGGRFVVYQNSLLMAGPLKEHFGTVKKSFEPRNMFPYFIMVSTRK